MEFTKRDICPIFVIVNSHCCCSHKDCAKEVSKNLEFQLCRVPVATGKYFGDELEFSANLLNCFAFA